MKITEAKSILKKLINNTNPVTNKVIPSNTILEEAVVREAFSVFLDFEYEGERTQEEVEDKRQQNLTNGLPINHGSTWSSCDKELLRRTFTPEFSVGNLADQFGRSELAIECQLFILGLIEHNPLRNSEGTPIGNASHADEIDRERMRQEVFDNGLGGTYVNQRPWL